MPEPTKPRYAPRGQPKIKVDAKVDPKVWRRHAAALRRMPGWTASSYIAALLEVTAPLKASR